jgi:hypothetical protein
MFTTNWCLRASDKELGVLIFTFYVQAVHEVYPCIIEFLSQYDKVSS